MFLSIKTMKKISYSGLKISSLLFGGWVGTIGYSKLISFQQNLPYYKNNNKISNNYVTVKGLIISGMLGSYIAWNII
tara:strand:- start:310 stop:540 length:231 start_codon:yes stop_codon:yes gene_type:complete